MQIAYYYGTGSMLCTPQTDIPSRAHRLSRKMRLSQATTTLGDLPAIQAIERIEQTGGADDVLNEPEVREVRTTIRRQILSLRKDLLKTWRLAMREPTPVTIARCLANTQKIGAAIDEALQNLEAQFVLAIRGEQTEQRISWRHKLMVGISQYYRLRGLVDHVHFVLHRTLRHSKAIEKRVVEATEKNEVAEAKTYLKEGTTLARAVAVSDAAKRLLPSEYRARIKAEADKTTTYLGKSSAGLPSLVDLIHENRQMKLALRELLAACLPILTVAACATDDTDGVVPAEDLRAMRVQFDAVKGRLDGANGMLGLLVDYRASQPVPGGMAAG